MANSESYVTFIKDQLEGFGSIETKKMFGALSFYKDGFIFGAIMNDQMTLKVDKEIEQEFVDFGMSPHIMKNMKMSYYNVSPEIIENKTLLFKWAEKSLQAAKRTAITNKSKSKKK